jgi:hypothetical protein
MQNFDWAKANAALLAAKRLSEAGHPVREANIPGLFDIEGIANDITINQLIDIAAKQGGVK